MARLDRKLSGLARAGGGVVTKRQTLIRVRRQWVLRILLLIDRWASATDPELGVIFRPNPRDRDPYRTALRQDGMLRGDLAHLTLTGAVEREERPRTGRRADARIFYRARRR